ncbi:MAG: ABC transporter ATP-binding protein, partial [Burkholderiales bacterium PBB5]
MAPHPPVLQISALAKAFASDGARVPVFADVDLQLQRGEFVAMLGESGVGKSTLLNCVAGLDEADSGDIRLAGTAVRALAEAQRAALRRQALGFVFQAFHLLPHLSV